MQTPEAVALRGSSASEPWLLSSEDRDLTSLGPCLALPRGANPCAPFSPREAWRSVLAPRVHLVSGVRLLLPTIGLGPGSGSDSE